MKDSSTGKTKQIYEFTDEAKEDCRKFFDETSLKLESLQLDCKHHLMSNYSKIRDLVLRVSDVLQVIEHALKYLRNNEDFNFKDDNLEQPVLPDVLKIEKPFITNAIEIIKASQDQKDIFQVILKVSMSSQSMS